MMYLGLVNNYITLLHEQHPEVLVAMTKEDFAIQNLFWTKQYTFADGQFTVIPEPVIPEPDPQALLEDARRRARIRVDAAFYNAVQHGFPHLGTYFGIDDTDRAAWAELITTVVIVFNLQDADPLPVPIFSLEDTAHTLSVGEYKLFLQQLTTFYMQLKHRQKYLHTQIAQALTIEAVESIEWNE